jgi:hypothetical protein
MSASGTPYDDLGLVLGHERDRPPAHALGGRLGRRDVQAADHRGEHALHLEDREARPQAAPHATAERDPRIRARRLLEEALGPERPRLGIDVGTTVDEVDARHDRDTAREHPPPDLERLLEPPDDDRHYRAQAKRLLDDGVEVGAVDAEHGGLRAQAGQRVRVTHEALDGPCQSSVTACMRGRTRSGSPAGQRSSSRSAISVIGSP